MKEELEGSQKTLQRLHDNFTWASIKEDTRKFVTACATCQHTKYDNRKPAGLLCPLSVPTLPWEDLSMDFITGLPSYRGNTCIFVVVDRFSKGLHLGILLTQHTAHTVALLFIEMVSRSLRGLSFLASCTSLASDTPSLTSPVTPSLQKSPQH